MKKKLYIYSLNNKSLKKAYPWVIWFLSAAFFFYKYVLQVSPSVMSADLMRTFSITGAGLGNLAACFFYAYLLMQIPVGLILDRWSPRIVTSIAVFIASTGVFIFAHAHSLWVASVSRAMMGFGTAFAAIACFKLTTIWFPPKKFALIAGLSMTAAMLGAVGGQAPLSLLVTHFGWRNAMLYVALPGFILMILIFTIIRDKKNGMQQTESHIKTIKLNQLWNQTKIIVKHPQTWLLSIYSGLAFAPVSVFGGLWGVSFFKVAYHLSAEQAASAISFIFIGFALGCPAAGWYSDYVGKRKIIMIFGTIIALITLLFVLYLPFSSLIILEALMFCFGLGASCFFLCFSMIREIHPLLFTATVLGFMNVFDSICEAISEPFIGKLLDLGWDGRLDNGARLFSVRDYHFALSALPIYFSLALLILFYIKETYCQQKI